MKKIDVIINGDSITEMNAMEPSSVDLIFADPPYYMRTEGTLTRVEGTDFNGCDDEWDKFESLEDYERFTTEWLKACYRILKPSGSIWVIGGMQCIYTIGSIMQKIGFWLVNDVVWYKTNPTPNFKGTRLNNSHETLIWATKSKKSKFTFNYKTAKELNIDSVSVSEHARGVRKQLGSVWRFSVCAGNERLKDDDGKKLHSTQKPIEMLRRIIAISSRKGDLILDPFGGTMTTGAAAKEYGRHYIMIEKDKKYCDYGERRLKSITPTDNDIVNAKYDEKPIKVTMAEMIEAGFFEENEKFCFKDGKPVAELKKDGKLFFNGEILDMHTCAAKARGVKAKRVNGFDYWYVLRNKKPTPINEIRNLYRKTLQ